MISKKRQPVAKHRSPATSSKQHRSNGGNLAKVAIGNTDVSKNSASAATQQDLNLLINFITAETVLKGMYGAKEARSHVLSPIFAKARDGSLLRYYYKLAQKGNGELEELLKLIHDITGLRGQLLSGEEQLNLGIIVDPNEPVAARLSKMPVERLNVYLEHQATRRIDRSLGNDEREKLIKRRECFEHMPGFDDPKKIFITNQVIKEHVGIIKISNNGDLKMAAGNWSQNPLGLNTLGMFAFLLGDGKIQLTATHMDKHLYKVLTEIEEERKGDGNFVEHLIDLYKDRERNKALAFIRKKYLNLSEREVYMTYFEKYKDKVADRAETALEKELQADVKNYLYDRIFSPFMKSYSSINHIIRFFSPDRETKSGDNNNDIQDANACTQDNKNRTEPNIIDNIEKQDSSVQYKDNMFSLHTIVMFILRKLKKTKQWKRTNHKTIEPEYKIMDHLSFDLPYPLVQDPSGSDLYELISNIIAIEKLNEIHAKYLMYGNVDISDAKLLSPAELDEYGLDHDEFIRSVDESVQEAKLLANDEQ